MNPDSILTQFSILESFIRRAKLPFETNMLQMEVIETSLWELIRLREQALIMIREISPERFGAKTHTVLEYPEPTMESLHTCRFCGDSSCQSDHK